MFPNTNLQPGQSGSEVQKLQDFLVSQGYLTQAQVNTGYGIYGPQTTQAVANFQRDKGIDNSSGPGFWGPRTIQAVQQMGGGAGAQQSGADQTMQAVQDLIAQSPIIQQYTQANPEAILNAYTTGDWSGVTTPSGQPFSREIQREAFTKAEEALAPGFRAQQDFETAGVTDSLGSQQEQFGDFLRSEAKDFEQAKMANDQSAADRGVLFAGSRIQRDNDLRDTFEDRQARAATATGRNITNTARNFQYQYGNENANKLSNFYNLPQGNIYNTNVATGGARPSMNLSSMYNPNKNQFQGTTLNTQKAQTQVRASGLLANKANKLLGTY